MATKPKPNPLRSREIAAIKIGAKQAFGDDDRAYRDDLEALTGKRSASDLTQEERRRVIESYRRGGYGRGPARPVQAGAPASDKMLFEADDEPRTKKIKAMWCELHRAGRVESQALGALNAWIARQTDVQHVRWLKPTQQNDLIEQLKKWLAR